MTHQARQNPRTCKETTWMFMAFLFDSSWLPKQNQKESLRNLQPVIPNADLTTSERAWSPTKRKKTFSHIPLTAFAFSMCFWRAILDFCPLPPPMADWPEALSGKLAKKKLSAVKICQRFEEDREGLRQILVGKAAKVLYTICNSSIRRYWRHYYYWCFFLLLCHKTN